jgi:hypothetical protein
MIQPLTKFSVGNGTHLPALIKAVNMTSEPILELGTGMFSTPYLHYACYEEKRKLVSYESDPEYYEWAKNFENEYHQVIFVEDWNTLDLSGHWSVALVDQLPKERRRFDIIKLKDNVDYIVAHDARARGEKNYYKYSRVYPLFKYRKDFGRERPFTVVLSNLKDLTDL